MSTEGISLDIVENATSEEMTKGDLKKAWERLERRRNPKTREDKVEVFKKIPQLQAGKYKAETYGLANLHGTETS